MSRKRHAWRDAAGLPWTPYGGSDRCAQCGSTPDAHPHQSLTLSAEQVAKIDSLIFHRLDWTEGGYMPSDLRHLVVLLVDHAEATTRGS